MKHHAFFSSVLAGFLLASVTVSQAATFSNFEPPTYASNSTFYTVDGWHNALGSGGSSTLRVTPDTGFSQVLQGSQSGLINSGTRAGVTRGWGSSVSGFSDPFSTRISLRVMRPLTTDLTEIYLGNDESTPSGAQTPVGLLMRANGNFGLWGLTSAPPLNCCSGMALDSGVPYVVGNQYLVTMVFNFPAATMTAFATNVTAGGPELSLGSIYINSVIGTFSNMTNNGGLAFVSTGATLFDDIQIVPEPSV